MKKNIKIIGAISVGVLVLAYAAWTLIYNIQINTPVQEPPEKVQLIQDPTLVSDAQQLGIDVSQLNLSFANDVSGPGGDLPDGSIALGSFTEPNIIKVKHGLTKKEEIRTVAYEYLHYVWINQDTNFKEAQIKNLDQIYIDNANFRAESQQFKDFSGNSRDTIYDEMNAISCTLIQPIELGPDYNKYCDSLIPNRAILFQ